MKLKQGIQQLLLVSAIFLSACATTNRNQGSGTDDNRLTIRDVLSRGDSDSPPRPITKSVYDLGEVSVKGVQLKNTQYDYPAVINSSVEKWVDYFCCGKGRVHFERYLERSDYFIPYIDPILRQNGMPRDLVYLAMIESGFNNYARSHAKAVGPWQFISATGKRYGLMVNWWVDERRDVKKSTLSAVQYLKDLYGMFQSWELAAAAYNAGEAKVARAIRRYGSTDFWVLARQKFFRPETRNYVPKIIAAAIVAKNRELYGFAPAKHVLVHPEEGEVLASDGSIVKVVKTEKPEDEVRADSDEDMEAEADGVVTDDAEFAETNTSEDLDVLAPKAPEALSKKTNLPIVKVIPTPHISKDGQVSGEDLAEFEVQSPSDLLKVARAAGLSYHTVKSLNPELRRWCTPPTMETYRIRLPASVKDRFVDTYNAAAFPREVKFRTHRVKSGETLTHVARRYGISVDPLVQLNGIGAKNTISSGREVKLPLPTDASRSIASLEVRDPPERSKRRFRSSRSKGRSYRSNYQKRESNIQRVSYRDRYLARKRTKKATRATRAKLDQVARDRAGG